MSEVKVSVVMGSDSDYEVMKDCAAVLADFGVAHDVQVMSAHRSPEIVSKFASEAYDSGRRVIIAAAGGAAHLAGVVAAHTTLPVIGVPINATPLNGFDALLATVQMPPGIPVATVAVGKFGSRNAALLAIQILATSDPEMQQKMQDYKKKMAEGVRQKNEKLQKQLA